MKRKKNLKESFIELFLTLTGGISLFITVAIVVILLSGALDFFRYVSVKEFFTGTVWAPLLNPSHFGVLPLLVGTSLIALLSSVISIPIGLATAIYLSEYAPPRGAKVIKPVLEILAGIPSIVYGYFALTFITPVLQKLIPQTEVFNALSASIAVGIMTLPMVVSLSEDAMRSVPNTYRYAAYALGSTRLEVATKVVVPAAMSGIVTSFILAISRAIGETMIVAIAAGANPQFTFNPLKSIQTMTGYMVNISLGDIQYGSIAYKTIFAVGTLLFAMTFVMNLIARVVADRQRRKYA
ncbi:phosphate ABC transporter permease [Carboxydothermus islandicus]|uniref:Phosphate transport system permease protein n=1 Tax=Carboxydothermus islandicus TaxID=661089 RepID=A0A1L8D196_9THEO|nr:phosphate ABC transporter permease subunit PstC [Carboxydothermus islandicus]GAV24928.1 phosphate ABC transporter permease [Carboxydothermus islandicus]